MENTSEFECPICLDVFHEPATLPVCRHSFCEGCLEVHLCQQEHVNKTGSSSPVPVISMTVGAEDGAMRRGRQDKAVQPADPDTLDTVVVSCPLCRTESRAEIHRSDDCVSMEIDSLEGGEDDQEIERTERSSIFSGWRDTALMKKMSEQSISCECAETVSMDKYVEHRRSGCSSACKESSPKVGATMADELAALASSPSSLFRSSASSTSAGSSGRGGYRCPYCRQGGFDCRGLLSHCETAHPGRDDAAVCPICVSREDGDPSRVSRHWVSHMRLRHRFEPEDYVEDEDEDDAILQRVLQASLFAR